MAPEPSTASKASKATAQAPKPVSVNEPDFQKVLLQAPLNTSQYNPSPSAWEDQLLYFLLPDRFSNGKEESSTLFTQKDDGSATKSPEETEKWKNSGGFFCGGTLNGIESKLEYLKNLGVTALWIGPIFKQTPKDERSYHGYAVQDFLEIDPHFGTRQDLQDLVRSAHAAGIYVILDIILNHCGDVFGYKGGSKQWTGQKYPVQGFRNAERKPCLPFKPVDMKNPPPQVQDCAIWPLELQDPSSFSCSGAIQNWDNYPEYLDGDFFSLKDINLGTSDNIDAFKPSAALLTLEKVYKYWIAFADIDGYRIDTVKHMGDGPTRHLCTTLHEYAATLNKTNFLLLGEVTGPNAFPTVETTGLDAALGIGNVQANLWRLPRGEINPVDYFDLFRNANYFKKGTHAWARDKVVTMIDDHDQVWRAGNDKTRFCGDGEGKKLVVAGLATNMMTLGIPCIFYGTEQGFDGHGDSDKYLRESMFGGQYGPFRSKDRHCFDTNNPVYQEFGKLAALRRKHLALRRGRQYLREISGNGKDFGLPQLFGSKMKSLVAWSRVFDRHELLCVLNTDTEKWTTAWVTLDLGLHEEGEKLECVYRWPPLEKQEILEVDSRNGRAVRVSAPPAGFAMYAIP